MTYRVELALLVVILGSLGPAAWMTIHREAGYDVVFHGYQDLQAMADRARVTGLAVGDGALTLRIEGGAAPDWTLAGDTRDAGAVPGTPGSLRLPLRPGAERYEALSGAGERLTLSTISGDDVPEPLVNNLSLPLARDLPFATGDFVIEPAELDPAEVAEAERLLRDMGVKPGDSARDRVVAIAGYLHRALYPHRGQPSPAMRRLSGFGQFQEALAGRSEIYCANHAEIFAFFANVAGVPTRLVDVGRTFDGLPVAAHAFAESYLPEQGGWAYVDLQLHVGLLADRQGRVLNGLDVLHRSATGNWDGLQPVVLPGPADGGTRDPALVFDLVQLFVPPEATLTYLWGTPDRYAPLHRLARLLAVPQPAYSLAAPAADARWRLTLTAAGLAAGLLLAGALLRRWLFRHRAG